MPGFLRFEEDHWDALGTVPCLGIGNMNRTCLMPLSTIWKAVDPCSADVLLDAATVIYHWFPRRGAFSMGVFLKLRIRIQIQWCRDCWCCPWLCGSLLLFKLLFKILFLTWCRWRVWQPCGRSRAIHRLAFLRRLSIVWGTGKLSIGVPLEWDICHYCDIQVKLVTEVDLVEQE